MSVVNPQKRNLDLARSDKKEDEIKKDKITNSNAVSFLFFLYEPAFVKIIKSKQIKFLFIILYSLVNKTKQNKTIKQKSNLSFNLLFLRFIY